MDKSLFIPGLTLPNLPRHSTLTSTTTPAAAKRWRRQLQPQLDAYQRLSAGLSSAEQDSVFRLNAAEWFFGSERLSKAAASEGEILSPQQQS
jgi:hypothetical protein